MPPMAAIFAIGSGSLAIPQLSEDFSEGARDFVNKCLTRYFFLFNDRKKLQVGPQSLQRKL